MINKLWTAASLSVVFGAALGCGDLLNYNVAVNVRYRPDGTLLVFAQNAIDLFAEDLSVRKASFAVSHTHTFSLSDDGTTAALSVFDQQGDRIELYSIPSGKQLSPIEIQPPAFPYAGHQPYEIVLSPTGDLVFVMDPDGTQMISTMFDTGSGQALWSTNPMGRSPTFSPDGSALYRMDDFPGSNLLGVDARTGTALLNVPEMMPALAGLAAMPDAHILIAVAAPFCYCGDLIELLSADDGSLISQTSLGSGELLTGSNPTGAPPFRCSIAAGLCAVEVAKTSNTDAGQVDAGQMDAGQVDVGTADADQANAANIPFVEIWSVQGTVRLVQTVPLPTPRNPPFFPGANDLAISPDGQFLVAAKANGDVAVYRISDGSLVNSRHYGGTIF